MFTQVEENYIKSLINTYKKEGYKYYLCHTVTENNNDYDICLYVSKEEIKAVTSASFDVTNAVKIYIDSSSRNDSGYNPSTHTRDRVDESNLSTIVIVDDAEFIYTNATCNYDMTSLPVNPDLFLQGTDSYSSMFLTVTCIVVLVITFLYTFFYNILKRR